MGEVWEAEQTEPIRRRVALKLVKVGMDTEVFVARFEAERQALALMNHPSIARVFDAGATENGRPYFVMELVRGVSLVDYCDEHRLRTRDRLALFIQVCEGVQHAHQKGIIHRDLKPSNVLVAELDGKPAPKIIDFGLAKATTFRLGDKSLHTELGQMVGTPDYMSPEQAAMTIEDVDTRTDVYSLGVMLYELLVGERPFDAKKLRASGIDEMRRLIREEEAPRPSTRAAIIAETSSRIRGMEPKALVRRLRGDLDWITMKALEKDRNRRFSTASELAADVQRHLDKQPVLAGPPSASYRVKKFVQRNRVGVAAAALVLLSLLAGIVGTTTSLLRAQRAEKLASEEAERARQISSFLVQLFEVSDPGQAQGETISARQILDQGARRIERRLLDQPATKARLMATMGAVYGKLGLTEEAEPLLQQSLRTQEELLGADHPEVAETLVNLAAVQHAQGDFAAAETSARRALEISERARGENFRAVAEALARLAWSLVDQERHEEAKPLFERALAILEAELGSNAPEVAERLDDLGILLWKRGEYAEAETLLQRALQIYENRLGPDDYQVRSTLNDLAALYMSRGRLEEAEELFLRALALKERVLGVSHREVADLLNNLAILYDAQERYSEAEPLLRRALTIYEEASGASDDVGRTLANLAWVQYQKGAYEDADDLYGRALTIYRNTLGPNHPRVAIVLRDQAQLYRARGSLDEAKTLLRRALGIREDVLGADHPAVAECLHDLAAVLDQQGKSATAEPLLRRALEIRDARLGREHARTGETAGALTAVLRTLGREDEATQIADAYLQADDA